MFVFQLMGGLGNQMFQYAAARALSLKRDIPFKIDFDDPYKFVKRKLNLFPFSLEVQRASWSELQKCKPKRRVEKRLWLLAGKDPLCKLVREKADYMYDPGFFSCPDGAYLSGFWQTEKYFSDIEDTIRSDFKFREPAAGVNKEWLDRISNSTSVSVHIRRGDVISVPKTNRIFGVMTPEYYQAAISNMINAYKDCVFFFFSDDIEWVKANIKTIHPCFYVDANDDEHNYEDLRLMSSCKHHIIANSSFSWWGAWLNADQHKKVIAPARWMSTKSIAETDHIPASWTLL